LQPAAASNPAGPSPAFRMVVGLGNPGPSYAATRHNIGFMVLDRLAAGLGCAFSTQKSWDAAVARGSGWLLCKPLSFMNCSGAPVSAVSGFYKVPPAEVLVVLDDAALPLGRLRFRPGGSAGGHNGLQSVLDHLGTAAVPRLRVGIGASSGIEMVDHVLGRFLSEERPVIEEALERAVEAVNFARANGWEAAMNRFN
jgi:peptidyl-tRNA hydrolase, PTH1 family